jgi:hypothetical protein
MTTSYDPIQEPSEVHRLAAELIAANHRLLLDAEVRIGYLWAEADGEDEPALKHGGYPAAALCRKVSLRDRASGMPDAQILIDKKQWDDFSPDERLTLLDHELAHPVPVENPDDKRPTLGRWKRDSLGRPVLRLRKHDVQLGVFLDVIERHQEKSLDYKIVRAAADSVRKVMTQQQMWG